MQIKNNSYSVNVQILALDICADTLVGDDMRRGISGGQKKRVNTGELVLDRELRDRVHVDLRLEL